jgi:hypothetical protein
MAMKTARILQVLMLYGIASALAFGQAPVARLELIPPSPVTNKIVLEVRGAVENGTIKNRQYKISLFLDKETPATLVLVKIQHIPAHAKVGVFYRKSMADWVGRHRIILVAESSGDRIHVEQQIDVLPSDSPSTRTIDGAWAGIVHWSEEEGRYWNADIRKLKEDDWRQQIQGMHNIGMDTVVIQEVFRNQAYYGTNALPISAGFKGLAYYPSELFPGRVQMASNDPLEAILSEADQLRMNVFLGVGLYAWFDFSAASLDWHKKVAKELWDRYGHHPSFYGWYVSEETYGNLVPDQGEPAKIRYRQEIATFFREFQGFCRNLAPEKPIMFAPNTFGLVESQEAWPLVLAHVDILCPFGFHRMPKTDLTGERAADTWQRMCDRAGTHLWMDMEAFAFEGNALIPRPIGELIQDLRRFPNFEKIFCYQYPGMFNSPESRLKPGGAPTVILYREYKRYFQSTSRYALETSK